VGGLCGIVASIVYGAAVEWLLLLIASAVADVWFGFQSKTLVEQLAARLFN
jgi:hypothetical protein